MFDENGDRQGLTQIEQYQGSVEIRVGFYDPSSQEDIKITWDTEHPVLWTG